MTETGNYPPQPDHIPSSLIGSAKLARAAAIGVPSFMRRAQAVERAIEKLHGTIRAERASRLKMLLQVARRLQAVEPAPAAVPEAALRVLEALRKEPEPTPGIHRPCRSVSCDVKALLKLAARFNRGWPEYLASVSLDEVLRAQENYNRYYAIEREMALPNAPPVAFQPILLFDRKELLERYPVLPND